MKWKGAKFTKKTMQVQGGTAYILNIRFKNRKPWRSSYLEKGKNGVYHKVKQFGFLRYWVTGDCPECKQMPCSHTAELLGWDQ